jgi:DNA end-binding protein Ku
MATDWDPSAYHDEYRDDLMAMIKRRAKKGTKAVQATVEAEGETRVLDLMAALRRSVADTKKPASKAKRTTRRKPAARSA